MLLLAENFDQFNDISDLAELFGYAFSGQDTTVSNITRLDDQFVSGQNPYISNPISSPMAFGERASGYLALRRSTDTMEMKLPNFSSSRRLVFGMSLGSGALRRGLQDSGGILNTTYLKYGRMKVRFVNPSQTNLFSIEVRFRIGHTIDVVFDNYSTQITDISPENGIPFNRFRKNFFEFYSDSAGAEGGFGTVKFAINGKTIFIRDNVFNSDYTKWGGDPSNPGSYYGRIIVEFGYHNLDASYFESKDYKTVWAIDSIYVCNETSGYYDDFFGPVHISTMYPDPAIPGDVNNWTGFQNGVQVEPALAPNASLVDTPVIDVTATDATYIEADTDNLRELYYMKNYIDPVRNLIDDPIAVNFRTYVKNIFSYGATNYDKGLIGITKASGNDISRETGKKIAVNQFTYKLLDLYFGVAPMLAVAWTWELLTGMQFGMESVQVKHQLYLEDVFDSSETVTEV